MVSPSCCEPRECPATPPLPHAHRPAAGHRIAACLVRRPTYRPQLRPCPTRRPGLRTTEGVSLSDPRLIYDAAMLQRARTGFTGANAHRLAELRDEDLAVADLPRARR